MLINFVIFELVYYVVVVDICNLTFTLLYVRFIGFFSIARYNSGLLITRFLSNNFIIRRYIVIVVPYFNVLWIWKFIHFYQLCNLITNFITAACTVNNWCYWTKSFVYILRNRWTLRTLTASLFARNVFPMRYVTFFSFESRNQLPASLESIITESFKGATAFLSLL